MKYDRKHTTEAIKNFGEVFTPLSLVDEMLDKIPEDTLLNPEKTVGDISGCGNGNFLIRVLERRMAKGVSHLDALKTIYGVDIDETNVKECKERLALGNTDKELWLVLNRNIICADALDKNHPGWDDVGYMWEDGWNEEKKQQRILLRKQKAKEDKIKNSYKAKEGGPTFEDFSG